MYKKNILLIITTLSIMILFPVVFGYNSTYAQIPKHQKELLQKGIYYYDTGDYCQPSSSSSQLTGLIGSTGNKLYMIGDSLTVGMRDIGELKIKLTAKGWQVLDIEATSGDRVSDALPKLDSDSELVKESSLVIVALGTNREPDFSNKINQMILKIRSHSTDAVVYWVNTSGKNDGYDDVNNEIASRSTSMNYRVLDWKSEITRNPSAYPYADNVHYTPQGYSSRSDFIANSISTEGVPSTVACSKSVNQTASPDVGFVDATTLPKLKYTYTPDTKEVSGDNKPNVLIGKFLAKSYGWDTGNQWMCLYDLYVRESNWNEQADNPTSSAYGIPQSLPGRKMASEGADWLTNPSTQIKWGLKYIQGRYKDPCSAIIFHNSHNWY